MRQCKDCRIILENDVRFCPNCGKSVASGEGDEPDLRLAALLTSASLHKIKKEWDAAIADATEALEIDPNNADVASLLAAIYEQKGNKDEAAVWYRIALDLDPKNAATRVRLDRVTGLDGRARRHLPWWWYAFASGAAALLVILTILLTVAVIKPQRVTERSAGDSRPREATRVSQVRSTTTPLEAPLAGPTTASTGSPGAAASRTSGEQAVKDKLLQSERVLASGAKVDDLTADPRQGVVTVTFSLGHNPPVTRARVLSTAWEVAREAFGSSSEAKFVTVRCLIAPGGPSTTQIAFVGDIARSSFESLGESPNSLQLEQAFRAQWWNPQIR